MLNSRHRRPFMMRRDRKRSGRAGLETVARWVAGLALVECIALASSFPARADDRDESSSNSDWRTSISVALKAQQQRAEGQISSSLATSSEGVGTPTPIPLDASNHDNYFTAIVPIELQIQTPAIHIESLGASARAFLGAGYQWVPSPDRDFLREGIFVPLPPNPTAATRGLGGALRTDVDHQWSVSAGVSIPIEIANIPIEIRPSLDYIGQSMSANFRTVGIEIATGNLRIFDIKDSEVFHYLGPRLTIETDAGHAGDSRWVVFAEAGIYSSRVAGRQRLQDESTAGVEWARFSYAPDALLFQVGAGVRVYWDPSGSRP